jgi:hypothetical protein
LVDLPARVLGRLPHCPQIGTRRGATAVLLHRAREGMRQAFLGAHPGTPGDPACAAHWDRMPACIREAATPKQSAQLLAHLDD